MAKRLNTNFVKIVNLLSDSQFHDGETIGKTLKMTRAAIWKAIKKLTEYDIAVNAVKGKGYALLEPLALLDAKKIKKNLQDKTIVVTVFEHIDSTTHFFKETSVESSSVCLAEYQSKGRGRLNRSWYAPFGKNIYLSALFHFQKDVSELSGLSLVIGLAVIKTISCYPVGNKLSVKWPNDILHDGKKLGGVLIDVKAETHGVCQAIISVGLNVNMRKDKAQKISQTWNSLLKIVGHTVDRNELCAQLINQLAIYVKKFTAQGLAAFQEEWRQLDGLMNKSVTLNQFKQQITGIAKGINEQGHLLLQLPNGKIASFSAGDVTLKHHTLL